MRRTTRLAPFALAAVLGAATLGCTSSGAAPSAAPPASSAPGTTAGSPAGTKVAPSTSILTDDEDDTTTTTKKRGSTSSTTDGPAADELPGIDADGQITDARVIREFLFNTVRSWGEQGLDPQQLAEGLNVTFPSLDLSGYQAESTPTRISLLSTNVQEKGDPGPENPYVVVFTVMQVDGTCLGGIIYGYPEATETIELEADAGDRCAAMPLYEARVEGQQLG